MIELQNITKQFNNVPVLQGINLTIPENSIFGIIGLSGAGKTTLLRCLNCLEKIDSGKIIVDGVEIQNLSSKKTREYQKTVGMIFQHFNLLASKTVYDNIALPLKMNKEKKASYDAKVKEAIAFVGLEEYADKYPHELSGGQKQRVGIARALVHKPKVLLCDEATSALDPQTSQKILELLQKVNKTYNISIVLITHQMEVIREICDEVALIEEGIIVEQGSVFDVFTNPQTNLARTFVSPIFQQELPERVKQHLISQGNIECYRLTFLNENADEPILSQVTQQYQVQTNILFGNISEIQNRFFGQLTVELIGENANISQVLQKLQASNIEIKKITLKECE